MANVKLKFYGTKASGTQDCELECYANIKNEIFFKLRHIQLEGSDSIEIICLDRDTAIKFHKELKKQISFLNQNNV